MAAVVPNPMLKPEVVAAIVRPSILLSSLLN